MVNVKVRQPAVAGSFYPQDPDTLDKDVRGYIGELETEPVPGKLKILICPHAGYVYSGSVAGRAYGALSGSIAGGDMPEKIFLLGPAHQAVVDGIAFSSADAWSTPLGNVEVSELSGEIVRKDGLCHDDDNAHEMEHSLEVQLPFLQVCYQGKKFSIIPLLMSDISIASVADILEKYLDENSLLIISTDLSHYMPYDQAVKVDQKTIESVKNLDVRAVETTGDACGKIPLASAVEIARRKNWKMSEIYYRNSGDTAGSKDAVVGYMSAYCYEE